MCKAVETVVVASVSELFHDVESAMWVMSCAPCL